MEEEERTEEGIATGIKEGGGGEGEKPRKSGHTTEQG